MNKNRVLPTGKKIYFASDFHLGAPNHAKSLVRERRIIRWLDAIKHDAEVIFLVGDLFDYWFEYKHVVPKGFIRFLGKLAELSDAGIEIQIFTGNHDLWMRDYFDKELNIKTLREPIICNFNDKKFFIGHGDGLGPGDNGYKVLKKIFQNSVAQFFFRTILHADYGMFLGNAWARNSWKKHEKEDDVYHFYGEDKEFLYLFCQEMEAKEHHDFYIFGHRHLKLDMKVSETARYINLGDWVKFFSYAVFDGQELALLDFE